MGNMFRCTLKSGGASGTGIPLIVTCSVNFAGKTITATDGTTTLTQTCPSTSPYTVQFDLPNTGSWTISGVIEGVTYSETISVTEYQLALNSEFDYETWVSLGGLDPSDYASLSDVFADEEAVRRLMLVHASADYLIAKVSNDVTVIDDFCANDTAMKWIGLCDYVCDGLTAITGVEAKLLASTYWERYLKDHVPTMTSNTAPYGTASATSTYSGSGAYKSFDGLDTDYWSDNSGAVGSTQRIWYQFTNPICVKKIKLTSRTPSNASSMKIVASNDGTIWVDIKAVTDVTASVEYTLDVSDSANAGYYLYYGLEMVKASTSSIGLESLQFYGRSLDVSVPTMTSSVLPYGTASGSSVYSSYEAWKAFDNSASTAFIAAASSLGDYNDWIEYEFPSPMVLKRIQASIKSTYNISDKKYKIQGYDGTNWVDLLSSSFSINNTTIVISETINNSTSYSRYRMIMDSMYVSGSYQYQLLELQFYGVSYSEKEFEAETTKKWLYDHGVELQVFTGYTSSANATAEKQADNLYLAKTNANSTNASFTAEQNDFTDYDLAFVITGDISFPQSLSSGSKSVLITTGELPTAAGTTLAAVGLFNKLNYLDISSVDQTAYLRLLVSNGSSGGTAMGMDIEEVWVE